jgi:hypothetical protein
MTTYKSTAKTEIMWGIYFLALSYFLVSFYSTFKLVDYTVLPSSSAGWNVVLYPKWFAVMYVWSIFLAGKGLLFLASSISKKGVRVTIYWVSSAFFIIPIVLCLHLTYMKRQSEKCHPATAVLKNK